MDYHGGMENIQFGADGPVSSRLIYGCMRLQDGDDGAGRALDAARDAGYTHFDHADIYGGGRSEEIFGAWLRRHPDLRADLLITSKCGIRMAGDTGPDAPQRYEFSRDWILGSVEGSLKRLGIERLDVLLLHRPDWLMDPGEVAEAFAVLKRDGKAARFGVSNMRPATVDLLQSFLDEPLVCNQVEVNIHNVDALKDGTLEQCRLREMRPVAWSPLGGVVFEAWGNTFSEEDKRRVAAEFDRQAARYSVEAWLIMLAWILKHPAGIAPIIGSRTPDRIRAAVGALDIDYGREDWYRLWEAREGRPVP